MASVDVLAAHLAVGEFGELAKHIWTYVVPSDTEYPSVGVVPYSSAVVQTFGRAAFQPFVQLYITGEKEALQEVADFAESLWRYAANQCDGINLDGEIGIQATLAATGPLYLGITGDRRGMWSINLELTPDDV